METNRIFSAEQIVVHPDLPIILKDYSKALIRANPKNIDAFSAEYAQHGRTTVRAERAPWWPTRPFTWSGGQVALSCHETSNAPTSSRCRVLRPRKPQRAVQALGWSPPWPPPWSSIHLWPESSQMYNFT